MPTTFYAAFNDDGSPAGLFRLVVDDVAKTLDLERLTPDGAWASDPDAIDLLQEPEIQEVDAQQAAQFQQTFLAQAEPSGDELNHDDVAAGAEADAPSPSSGL